MRFTWDDGLRRDEERLRRVIRGLVLACAVTPAAFAACSSTGGSVAAADGGAQDATIDDTSDDTSYDVSLGMLPDVNYPWCEAGGPVLVEAGSCDLIYLIPCGLPPKNPCLYICNVGTVGCTILSDGAPPPPPEAGDDAGDGGDAAVAEGSLVYVECATCSAGRRPAGLEPLRVTTSSVLGGYFARMAHLEAASVDAFRILRDELSAHGAPRQLLRAAGRSAREEVVHARLMSTLARRHGVRPARPGVARGRRRSLEAIATENAVEGCVREAYGAMVAAWQSRRAEDPEVRRIMRRVADDEARHAALALSVARWAESKLAPSARGRVASAHAAAVRTLRQEITTLVPRDLLRTAGLPTPAEASLLLEAVGNLRSAS